MSDHLDGQTLQNMPSVDVSDFYLFKGTRGVVFAVNVLPLSAPGPFHDEALYEVAVDLDGDAVEDLTLRVTFGPADAQGRQEVKLYLVATHADDHNAPGALMAQGYTDTIIIGSNGIRLFAGRAADPFYIEGSVVTAVKTAVNAGSVLDLSGYNPDTATNLFAGTNVRTIVVEVPTPYLIKGQQIAAWARTLLPTDATSHSGGPYQWRQLDRAANPLISTLFGTDNASTEAFNTAEPSADRALFGDRVASMVATVVKANNTHPYPETYGARVAKLLLPDVLPYRIGTDASYQVQIKNGVPQLYANGRDLRGNHPEQMFHLVMATPVPDGLDASDATGTLRDVFPYLSAPV
jgi:Domain of unknown function (DUF4331)